MKIDGSFFMTAKLIYGADLILDFREESQIQINLLEI